MNILHISSANSWRGGERQVQYLMEGLLKEGYTNYLMTPKKSILGNRTSTYTPSQIEFKKGLFSLVKNTIALVSFCKSHKVDLIHGHDSHAHTLLWIAYRFGGLKTKSIVSRRLISPIKHRSKKKYNYSKIEYIICISNAVKKTLEPHINQKSRLVVIHSTIDLNYPNELFKTKNKTSAFVVGYVAAFTEEKDHSTFLSAAKYLTSKFPETLFKFVLVGDGPLLEKYKIESKKINGDFVFTGFVEEVSHSYLEMDVLLHPSKSEALGTAILDGMKYGLPIVASKTGGIPEVVAHNNNGYLCDIGDYKTMAHCIQKLASDQELYHNFSKNSKEIVRQFESSIMVSKTIQLYQKTLHT